MAATTPPYCSHNGYFDEMLADIHYRYSRREFSILTGHLDYMKQLGFKFDRKHLIDLMKDMRAPGVTHYVLPDNLFDFVPADGPWDLEDWPTDGWPRLPCTLSMYYENTHALLMVLPDEKRKGQVNVYPMNRIQLMDESGADMTPEDILHSELHEDLKAAGLRWTTNTFALTLTADSCNVHEWMQQRVTDRDRNDAHYIKLKRRAAKRVLNTVMAYLRLVNSPPEYIQWDRDPNWQPPPANTHPNRRSVQPAAPRIMTLTLPKQIRVGVDDTDAESGAKRLQHTRSGHWRHYKNGRRVWIDSYVAGDPTLGSTVNAAPTIRIKPAR